jgi:hypothetical protein
MRAELAFTLKPNVHVDRAFALLCLLLLPGEVVVWVVLAVLFAPALIDAIVIVNDLL